MGGGARCKSGFGEHPEQMSAALLSRFDLVFILLDRPDEEHDKKLSEHIMRTHALAAQPPPAPPHGSGAGPGAGIPPSSQGGAGGGGPGWEGARGGDRRG